MAADAQLIGSAGNSATATVGSVAGDSTGFTKFLVVVQYFTNTINDPIGGTPTDTFSNTYIQIGSTVFDPSGDDGLAMFLCEAGTGGASHTVSLTFSPTPFAAKITLYAITGCLATALDVHDTANAASQALGSPISVATGALGQPNEVIVAASVYDTGGFNMTSWTSSTMTVLEQDPGGNPTPVCGAVGKLTVVSAVGTTVGLTLNGTGTVSGAVILFASFKAAAAPQSNEGSYSGRRNRPGRGPYSSGRYFRPRSDISFAPTSSATGAGAVAESSDVSAGSGSQSTSGSGSATEANDTVLGAGSQSTSGSGSLAEGPDIVAGTGAQSASGSGASAEGADTVAGSGAQSTSGSGATTEANDTVSGSGAPTASGSGAIAEGADQVVGSGSQSTSGSGAVSESADVVAGSGAQSTSGSGSPTEAADTVAGAGVSGTGAVGTIQEGADVAAGSGSQSTSGSGSATESADIVSGTGSQSTSGSGATTEAHDTVSGAGGSGSVGAGAPTEGADVAAGTGSQSTAGSGTIAESADTASGTGSQSTSGGGAIAEPHDSVAGTGASGFSGSGAPQESGDTPSGVGATSTTGTGAAVEQPDIVSGAGAPSGAGGGNEGGDTGSGTGSQSSSGSGAANESADVAAGSEFPAQIYIDPRYVVRRSPRNFVVKVNMLETHPPLGPKAPAEKVRIAFDFSSELPPGVTLTGVATIGVTVGQRSVAKDLNPTAIENGAPMVDATSTILVVPVQNGVNGCLYRIFALAVTTDPFTQLERVGYLLVADANP